MPGNRNPNRAARRRSQSVMECLRRRSMLWLLIPVAALAVVPVIMYAHVTRFPRHAAVAVASTQPAPADEFIRSIVIDDGSLGWRQLCPSVQAQIPQSDLIHQADAQRAAMEQSGVTLTQSFVGTRPRPTGGEIRVYVLTAHWPNGDTLSRTYSVLTQTSGCVEDVKNQ
jgi:hypothetical protein